MRSGLKNHRRHQRIEARINGPKAGRFAAAVLEEISLDQRVAERDEWVESGEAHEYSETCPCSECHATTDEHRAAEREYERMAR